MTEKRNSGPNSISEWIQELKEPSENGGSPLRWAPPDPAAILSPASSRTWYLAHQRMVANVNGTCVLCGRQAQRIGDLLEVNGQEVELCGPCMGLPVSVVLLDLAHLGRQSGGPAISLPSPDPNAPAPVG